MINIENANISVALNGWPVTRPDNSKMEKMQGILTSSGVNQLSALEVNKAIKIIYLCLH